MGRLLSVGAPDGTVKGYVEHPEVDPERRNGKLNVGGAVGSEGTLTVIKDMGLREPYVGQVHLVSGEIAEDFAMYFTASEQTPSLVSLGVLVGEEVLSAGGLLLVRMMPGASEKRRSPPWKRPPAGLPIFRPLCKIVPLKRRRSCCFLPWKWKFYKPCPCATIADARASACSARCFPWARMN